MPHTWQIFSSFEWLLYGQDSWSVMLLRDPVSYVNPLFLVLLNSGFHVIPNYSWKLKTLLCVPDVSFSDARRPDHCTHMSNCLFIQLFDIFWVHSESTGKKQWCFAPPPPINGVNLILEKIKIITVTKTQIISAPQSFYIPKSIGLPKRQLLGENIREFAFSCK